MWMIDVINGFVLCGWDIIRSWNLGSRLSRAANEGSILLAIKSTADGGWRVL